MKDKISASDLEKDLKSQEIEYGRFLYSFCQLEAGVVLILFNLMAQSTMAMVFG